MTQTDGQTGVTRSDVLSIVTRSAVLSIPGGPNILLDVEHGIDSLLNILPMVSTFFPQLKAVIPLIPLIKTVLATAEDIQARSDSSDIVTIVANHMHDLADELAAAFARK